MKKVSLLLMLIILSKGVFAQKTFKDKYFGISINEPKNWIVKSNIAFIDSLIGEKANESDLADAIDKNSGSILLASFYKFNQDKGGFIPVVQINILNNPAETFEDFLADMKESAAVFRSSFNDFSFINEPELLMINNQKTVHFSGKFIINGTKSINVKVGDQKLNGNQTYKISVRTKVYAIPYGNYFFQLSFTDNLDVKEDEKMFEELLTSIRIGK
ncbi:MAG: hypothetical protein EOO91_07810 [Pedobacter sp.]|nr:MAG: hypothetical protein EOO91_07810 [Pedobacter sp.]